MHMSICQQNPARASQISQRRHTKDFVSEKFAASTLKVLMVHVGRLLAV